MEVKFSSAYLDSLIAYTVSGYVAEARAKMLMSITNTLFKLTPVSVIEADIGYKAEDIESRTSTTPFKHNVAVVFSDFRGTVKKLVNSKEKTGITRIEFTFKFKYMGGFFDVVITNGGIHSLIRNGSTLFLHNLSEFNDTREYPAFSEFFRVYEQNPSTLLVSYNEELSIYTLTVGKDTKNVIEIELYDILYKVQTPKVDYFMYHKHPEWDFVFVNVAFLEELYGPVVNAMSSIQSTVVSFTTLKIVTKSATLMEEGNLATTNSRVLCQDKLRFMSGVQGKNTGDKVESSKSLGFTIVYSSSNFVSRRQTAYATFLTSKEAKEDNNSKVLASTLINPIVVTDVGGMVAYPVYKREGIYNKATFCFPEGYRDTASKIKRYIKMSYTAVETE